MRKTWALISPIYQPFFKPLTISVLGIISIELCALAYPYFFGQIINGIAAGSTPEVVIKLLIISFAIFLFQRIIIGFKDNYELRNLDFRVNSHVIMVSLSKLLELSIGQHRNQNSSYVISTVNKGESALTQLVFIFLYNLLPLALKMMLTVSVLFFMNITLGIVVASGIFFYIFLTIILNRYYKPGVGRQQEMDNQSSKQYGEILRNIFLVQINGQEEKMKREYGDSLEKMTLHNSKLWRSYSILANIKELFLESFKYLVLLIGIYQISDGQYKAGSLITFFIWTTNAMGGLGPLGGMQRQLARQLTQARKYFQIFEAKPMVTQAQNPIIPEQIHGDVEFKNVFFAYPKDDYLASPDAIKKSVNQLALKGISFKITAGKKIALVGSSGAGKSTIISMLLRAYDPDQGQVLIDGNDLRLLDITNLRTKIGLVEQNVQLFDNTLRYNITFGVENGRISDEELDRVCKMACVDNFYGRLTEKFETVIGENGIQLSGGERQRVGIARALIKNPAILIFDEATSSLDAVNEAMIQKTMKEVCINRTSIIIAHRLSTVKDADIIFLVEDGKIMATGTHEELIKFSPQYSKLVKTQMLT